jgi:hypothetical protein
MLDQTLGAGESAVGASRGCERDRHRQKSGTEPTRRTFHRRTSNLYTSGPPRPASGR